MAFSIFSDTLYGQNRLRLILSIYLGPKAPKKLHLIKEIFSGEQLYWLMSYISIFSPFQFFRTPCMFKNKFIYIFGTKGSQKNPPHKGKLFLESKYIDWSHVSQLLANFMAVSIFRTPYMVKFHFEFSMSMYWGQKAPKRLQLIGKTFSGEQLYWWKSYILIFSPFHGIFQFLGHPVPFFDAF